MDERDDDRALARLVLLQRLPRATVHEAGDAVSFAGHLADADFDLLITERSLGWADGAEVAAAVKRRRPRVPVIVFAAPPAAAGDAPAAPAADLELPKTSAGYLRLGEEAERLLAGGEPASRIEPLVRALSHDLQEPAQLVVRYARLLADTHGEALGEQGREHLELLAGSARRMQAMIQQVLEYTRLGTARREPVALDEAADEALANLRATLEESGAEIERDGPLPTVVADRGQMVQLFQNLIGNAVKFRSEAPPRVRLDAERVDGHWEIRVTDNGIGIDPRHHQRVFELFQRLHPASRYPGTGIGLALCRRIAEAHGGAIRVESAPTRGSRFTVELPGGNA